MTKNRVMPNPVNHSGDSSGCSFIKNTARITSGKPSACFHLRYCVHIINRDVWLLRTHIIVNTIIIIAATAIAPAAAIIIWRRCKGVAIRYRRAKNKAEYNVTMMKSTVRK